MTRVEDGAEWMSPESIPSLKTLSITPSGKSAAFSGKLAGLADRLLNNQYHLPTLKGKTPEIRDLSRIEIEAYSNIYFQREV